MKKSIEAQFGALILEDLHNEVKSEMNNPKVQAVLNRIVNGILGRVGIEPTTVLRRKHDGNSQAFWLVEKMIGEYLIDQKINW